MRFSSAWISVSLILFCGLCSLAQNPEAKNPSVSEAKGMPPRATPGDYQAQAKVGAVTIAAEFMGHSIPKPEGPLITEDYIVVETGFFGAPDSRIKLSVEDFSLRVNGKKAPLASQPYTVILSSVKDPEWVPPEQPQAKSKTSFGSGANQDSGPPPPVHVPIELQRAMAQHVQKFALPEGDRPLPVAGLIFFQYRNKVQSIHSIELIYEGPAGKAAFALRR